MSKIRIDKNDNARILLTEILPYEVPMLFSNDGFYKIIRNNEYRYFHSIIKQKNNEPYGIPFNYQISKNNEGDTRTLSIIHPFNQYDFVDFYKKYDSIIIHLCSKSPFSLRRVNRVAKYSYSPDLVFDEEEHDNGVETEPDIWDVESKIFKSYFIYTPVDLIYKFYERNEYQRLEQRFNYLWEFDISKCFYHIYTHSITWAIKDKETAKRNTRSNTFENTFDKLMQRANYNETNGIVVGPEVSRIFAEILLQRVDLNVLGKLEQKGLRFGMDYEVRRYVDDFFVFSNDEKILEEVLKSYQKELEFYKLYLNLSKTKKNRTPLITDITIAKRQIKKIVLSYFEKIIKYEENTVNIFPIGKPYHLSQNFIKDFQSIVRMNGVHYDAVNKDVVRLFKSELVRIFRRVGDVGDEILENFFLAFLDVVFYCYSLNVNSSSTFKVAHIIVLIAKFMTNKSESLKQAVFSKISRETEFVMTTYHRKLKYRETNIEILNLLIPLKLLGEGYLITEKKIREYFNLEYKSDDKKEQLTLFLNLNYFQIITLLYYFDDHSDYKIIKSILEKSIVKRFELEEFPFSKADFTCLFFDFVCCPFVSIESKRKILRHSKYSTGDPVSVDNALHKIMAQGFWFMNWNTDIDLERILKKKEWSSAY